jgi:hypothetical protein
VTRFFGHIFTRETKGATNDGSHFKAGFLVNDNCGFDIGRRLPTNVRVSPNIYVFILLVYTHRNIHIHFSCSGCINKRWVSPLKLTFTSTGCEALQSTRDLNQLLHITR